jgi:hypothetical protein
MTPTGASIGTDQRRTWLSFVLPHTSLPTHRTRTTVHVETAATLNQCSRSVMDHMRPARPRPLPSSRSFLHYSASCAVKDLSHRSYHLSASCAAVNAISPLDQTRLLGPKSSLRCQQPSRPRRLLYDLSASRTNAGKSYLPMRVAPTPSQTSPPSQVWVGPICAGWDETW